MPKTAKVGHPAGKTNTRRKALKRARAEIFSELQIKGVPTQDIADSYNLTTRQVKNITKWAEDEGIIESVSLRMQEQLKKVPNIYEAILDADPSSESANTEDIRKMRELQLKAARDLAKGYIFKQDSITLSKKTTISLEDFHKLRAARAGQIIDHEPERQSLPERSELPPQSDD